MQALLAALLAFAAVGTAQSAPSDFVAKRERARAVLKVHCGACHLPESATAQARALRVYDLSREDWAATLSERQLHELVARLRERQSLKPAELRELMPRGASLPPKPSTTEVEALRAYVDSELGFRALSALEKR